MDTVLNFRNTTINTSHNIKTVCKKRNLSFECFRNIRMSKEHLKVSARLQRSCNRQDVLLLNNSLLAALHSELVSSDSERINKV